MDNRSTSPMSAASPYFPALLLLFVGSGCAALIYEIVWFQLLQLVIGSSAVSLGVLLGTFMGGMCLGSLVLPRYHRRAPASAARLRHARARHRRLGSGAAVRHAARRRHLHGDRRAGTRIAVRAIVAAHLSAAADAADGRDAAGDRPLGRDDARRACRGSDSSTAATSPARVVGQSARRASTCCASTTWRSRPTSPSR